jgi:hypothetical protein
MDPMPGRLWTNGGSYRGGIAATVAPEDGEIPGRAHGSGKLRHSSAPSGFSTDYKAILSRSSEARVSMRAADHFHCQR